jgi:hypothetical protein
MVRGQINSEPKPSSRPGSDAKLVVGDGVFPQEALLQFVDVCIVPALVDVFLGSRLNLPGRPEARIMWTNYEMRHLRSVLI